MIESTKLQPAFVDNDKMKQKGNQYVKQHEPFSIFKPYTYPDLDKNNEDLSSFSSEYDESEIDNKEILAQLWNQGNGGAS